jgi:hypothetical protein
MTTTTEGTIDARLAQRWTRACVARMGRIWCTDSAAADTAPAANLALESAALLHRLWWSPGSSPADRYALRPLWNWLCQSLYALAVQRSQGHCEASAAAAALAHLCTCLALTSPADEKDREEALRVVKRFNSNSLWRNDDEPPEPLLSPLASLLGACTIYRELVTGPAAPERDVLTAELLTALVDPARPCSVVPFKKKKERRRQQRQRADSKTSRTGQQQQQQDDDMMEVEMDEAGGGDDVMESQGEEDEEEEGDKKEEENNEGQHGDGNNQEEGNDDEEEYNEDDDGEDDGDDDEGSHGGQSVSDVDEEIESSEEQDEDGLGHQEGGAAAAAGAELCVEDDDTVSRDDEDAQPELEGHEVFMDDEDAMEVDLVELAVENAAENSNASEPNSYRAKSSSLFPRLPERRRLVVRASMRLLALQYPHIHHQQNNASPTAAGGPVRRNDLTLSAENSLLGTVNDVIRPPKKPLNTKIIMRRAPTQEEFFRGSLSRNPIAISDLRPSTETDQYEPTVSDLRQHIASDLQMSDSAELIEIIVANKILDVNLKLRVVHQVLWRNHLMEQGSSGVSSSSGINFFSAGGGISMILSGGSSGPGGSRGLNITADTPASALPSLVATYRLAGVDGEATEDTVAVGDLIDPEAPAGAASPEEADRLLEKEYAITRLVTDGRGIYVLLRSIQAYLYDTLRKIRRDDVGCEGTNPSRARFKESAPCHGLTLLRHCAQLSSNRKKLQRARAPTILLNLLLEVLKTLEGSSSGKASEGTRRNPTAEILQELIESLTSDIASGTAERSSTAEGEDEGYESDLAQDAASMPLLLESIETISLSTPLRNIIAKLLPFLTYGQADLSRELARHFDTNIIVDSLADCESESQTAAKSAILMNTFVQTAISLPANDVCNSLRSELTSCGFVDRLAMFILKGMPKQPPPWSPALWQTGELPAESSSSSMQKKRDIQSASSATNQRKIAEDAWRRYFLRDGIRTAFRILTGLSKKHPATQARIAMFADFLQSCHWIEATSDNLAANVETNGLGLLAETLLDEMMDGNEEVKTLVEGARKKTRLRKKELAQERRNRALLKMSKFGPLAGTGITREEPAPAQPSPRRGSFSILAPFVGFFREGSPSNAAATAPASTAPSSSSRPVARAKQQTKGDKSPEKPSWLAEAEMMEDETGINCAVCQEGRTLQPSELLGLYVFVKKVSIPLDDCGSRAGIEGSNLLRALPSSLPSSLLGTHVAIEWFPVGRMTAQELPNSASGSLTVSGSGGRRNSLFTTTVSAGNGIHFSCHRRARSADRNHPKAPKSEWEGAALRNSRVNCNVILPLVSSRSSKVPLMAVDSALTDHQSAVSNLLGTSPKSMLWTVLHDVRFLLLRMAYGEPLNADCGGGSLSSNCQLLFYQLLMADMFDKGAQVDQPEDSQHARGLAAGLLAGCAIVTAQDNKSNTSSLTRGVADASPMAALTSILFHNCCPDSGKDVSSRNDQATKPHARRQWLMGRDYFLQGLLMCAGRRHARGLEGSGCLSSRGVRQRAESFAEWEMLEVDASEEGLSNIDTGRPSASRGKPKSRVASSKPTVEDFKNALRPMITIFAMFDRLSAEFTVSMDDVQVRESSERLVNVITDCQRSRNIYELLQRAKVTLDHDLMIDLLQKGMVAAY